MSSVNERKLPKRDISFELYESLLHIIKKYIIFSALYLEKPLFSLKFFRRTKYEEEILNLTGLKESFLSEFLQLVFNICLLDDESSDSRKEEIFIEITETQLPFLVQGLDRLILLKKELENKPKAVSKITTSLRIPNLNERTQRKEIERQFTQLLILAVNMVEKHNNNEKISYDYISNELLTKNIGKVTEFIKLNFNISKKITETVESITREIFSIEIASDDFLNIRTEIDEENGKIVTTYGEYKLPNPKEFILIELENRNFVLVELPATDNIKRTYINKNTNTIELKKTLHIIELVVDKGIPPSPFITKVDSFENGILKLKGKDKEIEIKWEDDYFSYYNDILFKIKDYEKHFTFYLDLIKRVNQLRGIEHLNLLIDFIKKEINLEDKLLKNFTDLFE